MYISIFIKKKVKLFYSFLNDTILQVAKHAFLLQLFIKMVSVTNNMTLITLVEENFW